MTSNLQDYNQPRRSENIQNEEGSNESGQVRTEVWRGPGVNYDLHKVGGETVVYRLGKLTDNSLDPGRTTGVGSGGSSGFAGDTTSTLRSINEKNRQHFERQRPKPLAASARR